MDLARVRPRSVILGPADIAEPSCAEILGNSSLISFFTIVERFVRVLLAFTSAQYALFFNSASSALFAASSRRPLLCLCTCSSALFDVRPSSQVLRNNTTFKFMSFRQIEGAFMRIRSAD